MAAVVLAGVGTVRESLDFAATQMNALAERSAQITQAVSTITSIAEQTNMLALNAAIEAARATGQLRGAVKVTAAGAADLQTLANDLLSGAAK